MRVNKFVAAALGVSRRKADELVEAGEITINGSFASVGSRIREQDTVQHHGVKLSLPDYEYIMLNKPVGYLCSAKPQGGIPTIFELLPEEYSHLKIAGRLDKDSSGLVMLSDDGDFIHRIIHPAQGKEKFYTVRLNKMIEDADIEAIGSGVDIGDQRPSRLKVHKNQNGSLSIEMGEGRNRQIRRTFEALGYQVTALHRHGIGQYTLGELAKGQWRKIESRV